MSDSIKEESNTICSVYGYECPSINFTKKILGIGYGESIQSKLVSRADRLLIEMDNRVTPIEKCITARELYERATSEELKFGTHEYGVAVYKQGIARMVLANEGVDALENRFTAIELFKRARTEGLPDGSVRYAESLVSEATAHIILAVEDDAKEHYLEAVALLGQARRDGFVEGTHDYASTMVDEAVTRLQLCRLHFDEVQNIEMIDKLLSQAIDSGLSPNTFHYMVLTDLGKHLLDEYGV